MAPSDLAELQRSIGIRTPRPNAPVTVSYPPGIGEHAEPGWDFRFVHHYGATPVEAVRVVLQEIGRAPGEVRVHLTGRPGQEDISLLARTRNRLTEGGEGVVREFAVFCGGITKPQVVEALAALHAERFAPQAAR